VTAVTALLFAALSWFSWSAATSPAAAPDHRPEHRSATNAQRHVVRHLNGALRELAARDLAPLTARQRENRAAAISLLEGYRDAGRYPLNRDYPGEYVPYFVDPVTDAHCAVGFLMAQTGHEALVRRLAAADNHVRVLDLAGDAEVRQWLDEYGITLEEAARIQPWYEPGMGPILIAPRDDNPLTNEIALKSTTGVALGLFALQRFTPFGRRSSSLPVANLVLGFVGMGLAAAAPSYESADWRVAAFASSALTTVYGIQGVQRASTSRLQLSVQPTWDARQMQARVNWRF
jgi:hypothetical protein